LVDPTSPVLLTKNGPLRIVHSKKELNFLEKKKREKKKEREKEKKKRKEKKRLIIIEFNQVTQFSYPFKV